MDGWPDGYRTAMTSEQEFRPPEPFPVEASEDTDFASEHESTSIEHLEGGPEQAPEPESPHGHAGLE